MADRVSKTGIQTVDLLAEDLYGVLLKARGEPAPLPSTRIDKDLYSAEDFYENDLQTKLTETRVFSDAATRAALAPTNSLYISNFNETIDIEESAYDYTDDLFRPNGFPRIPLTWKPVRSLTQVVFTWPGWFKIWQVPPDWLKLDRKFGWFDIVPTSGPAVIMTFAGWLLGMLAGGRGAPQSIMVDYVTGFTPDLLAAQHQNLLKGIRLRTILSVFGIASAIAAPKGVQSQSLGLDGLSRSQGWSGKYGPYTGAILRAIEEEKDIRDGWRAKNKGLLFTVL